MLVYGKNVVNEILNSLIMRIKCYSVRVANISQISSKAYKVVSYNGAEDIVPTSCIYGRDWDVLKSEAYWIASWILEQKQIQYSCKKVAWFDKTTKKKLPTYEITNHLPVEIKAKDSNEINTFYEKVPSSINVITSNDYNKDITNYSKIFVINIVEVRM